MPAKSPQGSSVSAIRDYAAFISYRHADNRGVGRQWASWLHHTLETYDVPADLVGTTNLRGEAIPARLFPVFRDEEELPADADLSTPILRALQASCYLVVLCSPGAVASRFVADEIIRFKAMGKSARIIAAILSGEPNASVDAAKQAAGIAPGQECFPEPLRFEVETDGTVSGRPAEPLAADFRLADGGEGWTSTEAYRQALTAEGIQRTEIAKRVGEYGERLEMMKLKVIAGILGVQLGVLTQRDKAHQLARAQKRARALRRWLAAVALLAALAVAGGVAAWAGKRDAEASRAETARTLAISDLRQAASAFEPGGSLPEGLAFAARAARAGNRQAATRIWTLLQQRDLWLPVASAGGTSVPADEATASAVPEAIATKFSRVDRDGEKLEARAIACSADGGRVIVATGDIVTDTDWKVRVWRSDGVPVTAWFKPPYGGPSYVYSIRPILSPDGKWMALVLKPWRHPAVLALFDVGTLKQIGHSIEAAGPVPSYQEATFSTIEFIAPNGTYKKQCDFMLLAASQRGAVDVLGFSVATNQILSAAYAEHAVGVSAAAVDPALEWLMSADVNGAVAVTDMKTGKPLGQPMGVNGLPRQVRRLNESTLAVVTADRWRSEFRLRSLLRVPLAQTIAPAPGSNDAASASEASDGEPNDIAAPATSYPVDWEVSWVQPRQCHVRRAAESGPGHLSPVFESDLGRLTMSEDGRFIATTTVDFETEMWTSDFSKRLGPPLVERRLFAADETPQTTRMVRISPDGGSVLIESYLWDPPNLAYSWYSVWDVATGLPLTDRIRFVDTGLERAPTVDTQHFDASGRYVLAVDQPEAGQQQTLNSLQLAPPDDMVGRLADIAEAIGGMTIDGVGSMVPVVDREARLAEALAILDSVAPAPTGPSL